MTCSTCAAPVRTQFASPGLVGAIVEDGLDPASDPDWQTSGAASLADYARWCGHLCGVTCLQMVLGETAPDLFALRDGALKYGGYTEEPDGAIRGLIYAPFADYVRNEHAVAATVHRHLTLDEVTAHLDEGRRVMASVHYAIRRPHDPSPGKGGHLVLLTARTPAGGVHFHNPSGTGPDTRAADLSLEDFARYFAGRGVSFGE
ncbi:peptidase [Streptomyces beijiangensis]|uniref:Peptidase n=1 Tax=Streptomyces beijiangensis TaxID=163361 RepID=A0A939JM22_9ACTN|nr:peptidase [Streptomyces beijiangensis]MBO0517472.1 peptidase [Streptomyces beijiangensis]